MKRWLPHPLLSALLAVVWLLLQQSLALPQVIAAAALAVALPRLLHGFLGERVRVRRGGVALRLAAMLLWDIVVANLTVARLALWPDAKPRPAWVRVPLRLRHPAGVSLLAGMVTMTPGTVSCVVDEAKGELLVHALDCVDAPALAADIQARYEAPLREIFE